MAEEGDLRPASLAPASDTDLHAKIAQVIKDYHRGLSDASFRVFWLLGKPVQNWGAVKVATELEWWLSGGGEEGCDITLRINSTLWHLLSGAGRDFLLDHFLSQVTIKEGGQTVMETVDGERQLYTTGEKASLKVSPDVIARHPKGSREIKEVKDLHDAIRKPEQFLITFAAEKEARAAAQEIPPPEPPPTTYDKRIFTDLGPAAIKLEEHGGELRVVGLHFFPDAATYADSGDLASLDYDSDAEQIDAAAAEMRAEGFPLALPNVDGAVVSLSH